MSPCDLHYYPWWCGDQCCVADINNILNPTYNIIWQWEGCHKIRLFYKWNSSYVERACNKYLLNIYNSILLLLWSITFKWSTKTDIPCGSLRSTPTHQEMSQPYSFCPTQTLLGVFRKAISLKLFHFSILAAHYQLGAPTSWYTGAPAETN